MGIEALEEKHLRVEIKELTSEGKFTGLAAVYEVPDMGNDVIQKGAFTKSIKKSKGRVPILWQHDPKEPIGSAELEDTDVGLRIAGQFSMAVPAAQKAHALLKDKVIDGLSIGFSSLKDHVENGIRYLSEIKLWEVSVVTFPMHPGARVVDVKQATETKAAMDFDTALDQIDTYAKRWQMISALSTALDSVCFSRDLVSEEKTAQSETIISQFGDAYMDWLPKAMSMHEAMEMMSATETPEVKVGRKLSAATRKRIEDAIERLKALLAETEPIPAKAVDTPDVLPVTSFARTLAKEITETLSVS